MFGEWEDQDDPEILKETEKLTKKILELEKQRKAVSMDKLKGDREIASLHGDSMAQLEAEFAMAKKVADFKAEAFERMKGLSEEEKEILEEQIDAQEKLIEGVLLAGETAEEAVQRLRDATTGMAKEGSDAGKSFFGGIASKMGLASKAGGTWIGKLQEMSIKMKDPSYANNFKKQFSEIFTLQNAVASGITMVIQATFALALAAEKSAAAFAKSTGTGRKYTGMLTDINQNNRELGITFDDAANSQKAAMGSFSDFGIMAPAAQKELTKFGAVMEKNGVSTETTMQQLDIYTKGMGMSTSGAVAYASELNNLADSLGMTGGELAKLNIQGMKSLQAFGKGAKKVFNDTMAMAKGLGLEMSDLLGFAEGFQTFEDSAKNVTSLNAVLGTSMSQMEMMAAEAQGGPAAAMEMMLKNFQKHGVEFDKLDVHTKRAVAHSMGIRDMTKAQKMFGGDLSGFRKYEKQAAEAAKKQENMEKKAQAAMDVQQNFMMAMQEFATELKPVITGLAQLSRIFLSVMKATGPLIPILVGVAGALSFIKFIFGPIMTIMGAFGAATAPAVAAGIAEIGAASTAAAPGAFTFGLGMKSIGLSALMIGVALALVIGSFIILVSTISELSISGGEAAIAMLGVAGAVAILSFALFKLATFGGPGAIILGSLAWGFTALALGVAAAGMGIATAFSEINAFIDKDGDLIKVAGSLDKLASSFSSLSMAMSGGGLLDQGLNMISGGLYGMITGRGVPSKSPIQQMVEDLQPLIDNADTLAIVFGGLQNILNSDIGSTMKALGTGLDTIGNMVGDKSKKGVAITHTLENLALITTGTSAGTNSGVGAIVKALTGFGDKGMNITIKLDQDQLQNLFENGTLDVMAGLA